jgi:phosphoenolpyruvate carboxykinase (ATP)
VYANLLGEKIQKHKSNVWLINTGWTGGPFGVGTRIRIPYTRAMIRAALTGALVGTPTRRDPYFGIAVPEHLPDVPDQVLNPRGTWADPNAYDAQANLLVSKFIDNFKQFESQVSQAVIAAGPALQ